MVRLPSLWRKEVNIMVSKRSLFRGALLALALQACAPGGGSVADTKASPPPRIECKVTVSGEPEEVWALWTTPEGLERFLVRSARVVPEVGGQYSLDLGAGYLAELAGVSPPTIRAIVQPSALSFDWIIPLPGASTREPKTTVTIHIDRLPKGRSHVRLEHEGWNIGDEKSEAFGYSRKFWSAVLKALRHALERREGGSPTSPSQPEKARSDQAAPGRGHRIKVLMTPQVTSPTAAGQPFSAFGVGEHPVPFGSPEPV
jgi:uncharacterized protein YndB with AHSA1/START domain